MKKRLICFILSVAAMLSIVAGLAPGVSAAGQMTTSEAAIALLKEFEGFSAKAYYDNGQYSIGYGTVCNKADYPNGITKEKADQLLRSYLVNTEDSLNAFAQKRARTFSQQEFDALISFTYNLGAGWMNQDSDFRKAVINGASGNDFLFAITRWCTAGETGKKEVQPGLVQRRLAEANLYLNGIYSKTVPENYKYVIFDNNMDSAVSAVKIQGYLAEKTDRIRATASKTGYRFLGWYTQAQGGEWVTTVGPDTAASTLYGHWQRGEGDKENGLPCRYQRIAIAQQTIHESPGGKQLRSLSGGESLTILADYMDGSGIKWGKLSIGGWVDLIKTDEPGSDSAGNPVSVTVHVTADDVNVRSGPGINYSKAGKAERNQEIAVTNVRQGGQYLWGQFSDGWICLDYTDYQQVMTESAPDANVITAVGVVINTDKLNIRSRPTTGSDKVGTYSRGEKIQITLQQKQGSTTWGKTDKGWVSLDYVQVSPVENGQIPTQPQTPVQPEAPEKPESSPASPETNPSEGLTSGTVVDCTTLRIRAGAGTNYKQVGSLVSGTQVQIYEMTLTGSQAWGRISNGWISLNYVKLDQKNADSGASDTGVTGVVVGCTRLNVRSGAGTNHSKVGYLDAGTKVQILEQTRIGNTTWGRTQKGWISLYYVQLQPSDAAQPDVPENESTGTGSADGSVKTGVIIGTEQLRVRSAPGVNNPQVGTMRKDQKVVILEMAKVGDASWGRTDKGWIHMYYVKLEGGEVPSGAVVRTVTASSLKIRESAGTSHAAIGSYPRGTQVVILEQTRVNGVVWGRTAKGWISLDYVK